jgi:hypothetical protein
MVKLANFPVFSTKKQEKTNLAKKHLKISKKHIWPSNKKNSSQMSSHRLKLIFRTKNFCKNNYVRLLTTTHTTVPWPFLTSPWPFLTSPWPFLTSPALAVPNITLAVFLMFQNPLILAQTA